MCPICASGSRAIHGCIQPRPKPLINFVEPRRPFMPSYPGVYSEPIPFARPFSAYGETFKKNEPDKIEASVEGVLIRIPRNKAGVALAKEVLKLLEKQVD